MERESVKYGTKTVFSIQCVNYFCRLLKFHFPNSGYFLYNFSLDNSNYFCQHVTSQKIQYCSPKHRIYIEAAECHK